MPSLSQVGGMILVVMFSCVHIELILLKNDIAIEIATIAMRKSRKIRIFNAFFIQPRKSYNKDIIYILKIRQSMQKCKKDKKVLDKVWKWC